MSVHSLALVQSLVVISAANSAPPLCKRLLGARLARAIDGGLTLRDGYPLLGSSKTWRGLIAAIVLRLAPRYLLAFSGRQGRLPGHLRWQATAFRLSSNGGSGWNRVICTRGSIRFPNPFCQPW